LFLGNGKMPHVNWAIEQIHLMRGFKQEAPGLSCRRMIAGHCACLSPRHGRASQEVRGTKGQPMIKGS
jgi:hypothetical protein